VPLIYLSCAWVAGIFLGSRLNLPLALIFIGFTPLPLLFFRKYRKPIILTSLCLIALFGGASYYRSSQPTVDENRLQFYNSQGTVEIEGVVNRDPEVRDKTTHLHLSATNIKLGEEWHEVSGTALLIVPTYPAYKYGDMLSVKGELESPYQPDDFDSTMHYSEIEITGSGAGFKPLEWVYSLRNRLSQTLAEVLPEPQASLAQGIILGIRGNIPSAVTEAFSRTGTAHLLAISGLHLSILALISLTLSKRLFGKRHYIYVWLTLATVWLYALITGMNPPVIRAAIMVSLFLTAELLGRQRSAITALAFAAAVMVGTSPRILWDASFHLSFLAMTGLIFIFPLIQALSRKAVNATLGEEGVAASSHSHCYYRQPQRNPGSNHSRLASRRLLLRHCFAGRSSGYIAYPANTARHHYHRCPGGRDRNCCPAHRPGHRLDCLALPVIYVISSQRFCRYSTLLYRDRLS